MSKDLVLEKINEAKKRNKLSHAYLITGPKKSGKFELALNLAKNIFCELESCGECKACVSIDNLSNPDLSILETDGEIKISDIREVQKMIQLKPYLWSKKVIIIRDAHKLNKEASNALLKTLEEPPLSTVLILTSSGEMLETIKSRCQQLRVPYFNFFEDEVNSYSFLSGGIKKSQVLVDPNKYTDNINLFKEIINSDISTRFAMAGDISEDNLASFLESVEIFLRKELYQKLNLNTGETNYSLENILNIVDKMQKTKEYIGVNVNPKLALENFFLNI